MEEQKTFTDVTNAEGAKVAVRLIKETEKAIQAELKLTVWLPKSVVKKAENGTYNIPFWMIAKSIK